VIQPLVTLAASVCPIQGSKSDIYPPKSAISFADHDSIWMIRTPGVASWEANDEAARGTNSLPQMTAAEFAASMKRHSLGVSRARIIDTTGQCPGISWSAVRRGTP
jgi:hypothetical protein